MFSKAVCFFNGQSLPVNDVFVGQKRKLNHIETTDEMAAKIEKVVKRKALERMVEFLKFERDSSLDGGTECESENIGALSWTHDDKSTISCGITSVMVLIQEDSLRDYNDVQREFTVSEHCGLHIFPRRLRKISENLRFAALEAESAGFSDFPPNNDYKPTNDWMPNPINENGISKEMNKLADLLNIGRYVNDDQDDEVIGNLAWFHNGKTFYCPISAVVDLIENDTLNDNDSEDHLQFLEDYGSLSLFPIRLRELAQHLEQAAIAAIDLNFLTIPDCDEDCSESEDATMMRKMKKMNS